jgi:hypothetical protein
MSAGLVVGRAVAGSISASGGGERHRMQRIGLGLVPGSVSGSSNSYYRKAKQMIATAIKVLLSCGLILDEVAGMKLAKEYQAFFHLAPELVWN